MDGTARRDPARRCGGLDDLVRASKVVSLAICDTPAWRVAETQVLAALRGWAPLVALQIGWGLVERTVERELAPMARALGLGVLPWAPPGGGVPTGEHGRADLSGGGQADIAATRKGVIASSGHETEDAPALGDLVREIAGESGASPSQIAIAWLLGQPGRTPPILGARGAAELADNLGALDVSLDDGQRALPRLPARVPRRAHAAPDHVRSHRRRGACLNTAESEAVRGRPPHRSHRPRQASSPMSDMRPP